MAGTKTRPEPARTTRTKKRIQQGLEERRVEDPELEDALERMFELREPAKEYANACAEVKRIAVEKHDIKPEETIRCGEYVIPGVKRQGGGHKVPQWERIGIGSVIADSGETIDE